MEGKMTTILTKNTANEVLIEDATILKTIDRTISKTIVIIFITDYIDDSFYNCVIYPKSRFI